MAILTFKNLQPLQTLSGDSNLGGDFALPREFDSKKFASSFIPKGNAVIAAKGRQTLIGTSYTADGWQVWKYPAEDSDEKPHPKAGESHEVTERSKGGGTFVLMYRSQAVQVEVNQAYGEVSRQRMSMEATGQTVAGANVTDDPGMLGKGRLPSEPNLEEFEPPQTVEGLALPADQKITKKSNKLSK